MLTRCTPQRQTNFLFSSSPLPHLQTEPLSYKGETYSLSGSTHRVKKIALYYPLEEAVFL